MTDPRFMLSARANSPCYNPSHLYHLLTSLAKYSAIMPVIDLWSASQATAFDQLKATAPPVNTAAITPSHAEPLCPGSKVLCIPGEQLAILTVADPGTSSALPSFFGNHASDRSERLMPWSIARFVLFKVVFSSCDDEHIKAIPLSSLA